MTRTTRVLILIRVATMIVALCGLLLVGCKPVPRSLPPMLKTWAAEKAQRLSECYAAGHRRQALLECLGDYSTDRGTYACERAAALASAPD